ncbi:MAG TPA: hypothetical protein VMY87_04530 [Armatimonadota bacterium]|nr:hypothetical protein [Armatimonadota bacterium]
MDDGENGGLTGGAVVAATRCGAFVELPKRRAGLVHLAEGAGGRATNIGDHRHLGGKARSRKFETDKRGYTEVPPQWSMPERAEPNVPGGERNSSTFEEKLRRFLKQSQERQGEVKRNTEAKRGRGRRR